MRNVSYYQLKIVQLYLTIRKPVGTTLIIVEHCLIREL